MAGGRIIFNKINPNDLKDGLIVGQYAIGFTPDGVFKKSEEGSVPEPIDTGTFSGGGGSASAFGTINYVAKFTNSSFLSDSSIYDDGNNVTVYGGLTLSATSSGIETPVIKITQGSSAGYYLISDSNGLASWTSSVYSTSGTSGNDGTSGTSGTSVQQEKMFTKFGFGSTSSAFGNASAFRMAGLGLTFSTQSVDTIEVSISFNSYFSSTTNLKQFQLRYGTGSSPSTNSLPTGNIISQVNYQSNDSTNESYTVTISGIVTNLTPSSIYWFDLAGLGDTGFEVRLPYYTFKELGVAGNPGTSGTSGTDGTSGTSGTDGTSGTSGTEGTSGTSGTEGTSGTSGTEGTSGTSGTDGTSGTSGTEGTSGTSGTEGTSGTSGTEGTSGTSGTEGTSGTSGTDGTSGTSGTDGTSGTSGTDGTSGTSGTEGTSGTSGTEGTSGTSGTEGTSGTSGTEGTSGTSGTEGTSGTSGTEGTSGTSGTEGTSGTSGTDGTSGTSGTDGTSGTSGTDGTSGTSGTEGTSGTSGTEGTSGTSGTEGTSGTSGTEGTSGTSGTEGTSGTSGTEGTSGTSGTEGTSGTTGTSGTSGTTGTSGTSGNSGINGVDGTSGTTGTSGTSGTEGTSGTSGTGFNTVSNFAANRILTSDGTSNSANAESNLTFDGSTLNITGDLVVSGDLTINGTTSTISTINLIVEDPLILLAATQSGSPSLDSGLMINRGNGATQAFIWDESADEFAVIQTNDSASTQGNLTISTYSNFRAYQLQSERIKITDGAQSGYILISDSQGLASWTASIPGTSGTSGSSGTSGTSGTEGTSGTSGTSGTEGTSGTSGTSGTEGTSGTSGTGFNTINNPSDNRILTSDGGTNSANAESNLTFNGNTLNVNGDLVISGQSNVPVIYTSVNYPVISGSNSIYSFATTSYTGAFVDYTANDGNNARAGNINAVWIGSNIQFSETSTVDVGDTTGLTLSFVISGTYAVLQADASSSWQLKAIIRSI